MNDSFFISLCRAPPSATVTKAHASATTIINAELFGTQVNTFFLWVIQNPVEYSYKTVHSARRVFHRLKPDMI